MNDGEHAVVVASVEGLNKYCSNHFSPQQETLFWATSLAMLAEKHGIDETLRIYNAVLWERFKRLADLSCPPEDLGRIKVALKSLVDYLGVKDHVALFNGFMIAATTLYRNAYGEEALNRLLVSIDGAPLITGRWYFAAQGVASAADYLMERRNIGEPVDEALPILEDALREFSRADGDLPDKRMKLN